MTDQLCLSTKWRVEENQKLVTRNQEVSEDSGAFLPVEKVTIEKVVPEELFRAIEAEKPGVEI